MKMFSTEIQSKKFPICIRHLINFSSAVLGHKQNVLELFLSTFLMRPCGIELKYIECLILVRRSLVSSFKETKFQSVPDLINFSSSVLCLNKNVLELFSTHLMQPSTMQVKYIKCLILVRKILVSRF